MDSLHKLTGYIVAINLLGASAIFSIQHYRPQIQDTYKKAVHNSIELVKESVSTPQRKSIDTYCIADSTQNNDSVSGLIR